MSNKKNNSSVSIFAKSNAAKQIANLANNQVNGSFNLTTFLDKNKEMDIFMVRQLSNNSSINNVVVELKHPKVKLGSKQLDQVKTYMGVILEQDEFIFNLKDE